MATGDVGGSGTGENRGAEDLSERSRVLIGFATWGTIGTIVALNNDSAREFILESWWQLLIAAAAGGLLLFVPSVQGWLGKSGLVARAGFFSFGAMTLILLVIGSVIALPPDYQVIVLRIVFLLVMCLLPPTMWFLFMATRKASLFNEFLGSLERLGLMDETSGGQAESRARRVVSYLQRFEAVYGTIAVAHRDERLRVADRHLYMEASGTTTLSTTVVPLALSTVLIAMGWLLTLSPTGAARGEAVWAQALAPNVSPITIAFLGAYFFSIQMLFRRYVLKDLRGSAYVAISLRIILAWIGIWVLMQANAALDWVAVDTILIAAFVIGVFPRVFMQVLMAAFRKTTRILVESMVPPLPVSDLDGLTVWHEARLEEEDIENVPNMATADLVELLLNTRVPPERLVDWIDQAILFTLLGAEGKQEDAQGRSPRSRLRAHGIRTATSLVQAAAAAKDRAAFDAILRDADGASAMPSLEATLETYSNFHLIRRWRGMQDRPRATHIITTPIATITTSLPPPAAAGETGRQEERQPP